MKKPANKNALKPKNQLPLHSNIVKRPTVNPAIVDRLAFLLNWDTESFDDRTSAIQKVKSRLEKLIEDGTCERSYLDGYRYHLQFRIPLDGGSHAQVQMGAKQPGRQKGGIRILVNPARFKDGDAEQIHKAMRKLIGRDYWELIKRPLINCIDLAVDIHGISLDNVLVNYKNGQRVTMFAKRSSMHAQIEGYNFGSVTSDYFTAVYSKDIERVHLAVSQLAKSGLDYDDLKLNVIKVIKPLLNAPPTLRVEIRGKKLRGKPISKLKNLPNRFAYLSFIDLNCQESARLSPLLKTAVIAMCRQIGVKATLAQFRNNKKARAVNAFLRASQAQWWKPDSVWETACTAIRNLDLFPEEAFE